MKYKKNKYGDENGNVVSFWSTDDNVLCEDSKTLRENLDEVDTQLKDIANNKSDIVYRLIQNQYELKSTYSIMSNPPEISVLTTSSLENGTLYYSGKNIEKFFFPIGKIEVCGDSYPLNRMVRNKAVTTTSSNGSLIVEFVCDADKFELWGIGKYGSYKIFVDDDNTGYKYGYKKGFTDEPMYLPGTDVAEFYILHDFGEAKSRKIKLEIRETFFGGIKVPNGKTIEPVKRNLNKTAVFLGDSYSEHFFNSWCRFCGELLDWDFNISGVGGTGYVNPGENGRVKLYDRLDNDLISLKPDYIIIAVGINDSSYTDIATFKTEADKCFKKILKDLPNSKIFIFSPWWPHTPYNVILEFNTALKEIALNNKLPYIDSLTGTTYLGNGNAIIKDRGSWLYGNGNVNKYDPNGNDSYYISNDNTHPTIEGYRYLGNRAAREICEILKRI